MTHNNICGSLCGGRDGSDSSRHRLLDPGQSLCEGALIHGNSGRSVAGCVTPVLADSPFLSSSPGQPLCMALRRAAPRQRTHAANSNPAKHQGLSQAQYVCQTGAQCHPAKPSAPMAQPPVAKATATPALTADLTGPFFLPRGVWSGGLYACLGLTSQTESISKQAAHAALLTIKRKDHIIAVINH